MKMNPFLMWYIEQKQRKANSHDDLSLTSMAKKWSELPGQDKECYIKFYANKHVNKLCNYGARPNYIVLSSDSDKGSEGEGREKDKDKDKDSVKVVKMKKQRFIPIRPRLIKNRDQERDFDTSNDTTMSNASSINSNNGSKTTTSINSVIKTTTSLIAPISSEITTSPINTTSVTESTASSSVIAGDGLIREIVIKFDANAMCNGEIDETCSDGSTKKTLVLKTPQGFRKSSISPDSTTQDSPSDAGLTSASALKHQESSSEVKVKVDEDSVRNIRKKYLDPQTNSGSPNEGHRHLRLKAPSALLSRSRPEAYPHPYDMLTKNRNVTGMYWKGRGDCPQNLPPPAYHQRFRFSHPQTSSTPHSHTLPPPPPSPPQPRMVTPPAYAPQESAYQSRPTAEQYQTNSLYEQQYARFMMERSRRKLESHKDPSEKQVQSQRPYYHHEKSLQGHHESSAKQSQQHYQKSSSEQQQHVLSRQSYPPQYLHRSNTSASVTTSNANTIHSNHADKDLRHVEHFGDKNLTTDRRHLEYLNDTNQDQYRVKVHKNYDWTSSNRNSTGAAVPSDYSQHSFKTPAYSDAFNRNRIRAPTTSVATINDERPAATTFLAPNRPTETIQPKLSPSSAQSGFTSASSASNSAQSGFTSAQSAFRQTHYPSSHLRVPVIPDYRSNH